MAFRNLSTGRKGYPFDFASFICDFESDIQTLPTTLNKNLYRNTVCSGSTAFVIENSKRYTLNVEGIWTETFQGGSSSGISPNMFSTLEEFKNFIENRT